MTNHYSQTNIYLLGMPGSGKTTLGKKIAKHLGFTFIDLDVQIEAHKKMSVQQIFALEGESSFREAEQVALKKTIDKTSCVIATGGGTPCFEDNMEWMNQYGKTVYLKANPALLKERLVTGISKRPLLQGLNPDELPDFLEKLLAVREPYYTKAQHIIYVPVKSAKTLVESLFQ